MGELNHAGKVIAVITGIFLPLATLTVIVRFYTRAKMALARGLDDWFILVALVFYWVYTADVLYGIYIYAGVKEFEGPEDQLAKSVEYLKSLYFQTSSYVVSIYFVKFSVIAFYRRLFSVGIFPHLSAIVGVICFATCLSGFVAGFLYCIPMRKFWDPTVPGHCFNFDTFFLAGESINVILDVVVLALPLKALSKLQLPLKKKLGIGAFFLLGGFVVITGIVRIVIVYKPGQQLVDFTAAGLWTIIQLSVAIVGAYLPTYGPLWPMIRSLGASVRQVYSSLLGSRTGTATSQSGTDGRGIQYGNGIPGTNSYYRKMGSSNDDHVHLTEIHGRGVDKDSQCSIDPTSREIRVKHDVEVA